MLRPLRGILAGQRHHGSQGVRGAGCGAKGRDRKAPAALSTARDPRLSAVRERHLRRQGGLFQFNGGLPQAVRVPQIECPPWGRSLDRRTLTGEKRILARGHVRAPLGSPIWAKLGTTG